MDDESDQLTWALQTIRTYLKRVCDDATVLINTDGQVQLVGNGFGKTFTLEQFAEMVRE